MSSRINSRLTHTPHFPMRSSYRHALRTHTLSVRAYTRAFHGFARDHTHARTYVFGWRMHVDARINAHH